MFVLRLPNVEKNQVELGRGGDAAQLELGLPQDADNTQMELPTFAESVTTFVQGKIFACIFTFAIIFFLVVIIYTWIWVVVPELI